MYLDTTVEIPEKPGKIVIQKKGDSYYVHYEYARVYDEKRKFNIPKRTVIGKVAEGNKMYPNPNFLKYFPSVELPVYSDSNRSCCLRIGSWIAIKSVLKHYGLEELINRIVTKDAALFLDLVSYSIICENNAAQYYPDYAFNHPLFTEKMKIYSDAKVSLFLSKMPKEWSVDFLNEWNAKKDHREKIYISYDSTNKNSQAGDIELVEYGHAKEEKDLPVINYSIAYDTTNSVPLFYEDYPGSIVDISQLQCMLEKALSYGYKHCGFILDRGYFSKGNLKYMDSCGYDFVIMAKGMKSFVSSLVMANRRTFEDSWHNHIKGYDVYGKTIASKLYADDEKVRYIHIYYSAEQDSKQRSEIEVKLQKIEKILQKYRGKCAELPKEFFDYYQLYTSTKTGNLEHWKVRDDVVTKEIQLCGYFCIITSEKMEASEALSLYKSRDASEKLFRSDKSYLGNHALRVCSTEAAEAKILVEFVALIVRNRIYSLLKDAMLEMERKPNFMTVPAALRELEKMEMVKQFDGVYRFDHAITKTQKTILKALYIDDSFIRSQALEISSIVGSNASKNISENVTVKEEEEDGTYEEL